MSRKKSTSHDHADNQLAVSNGYSLWANATKSALSKSASDFDVDVNAVSKRLGVPTDPYSVLQWHLSNKGQNGGVAGVDLNVAKAWQNYTGAGVKIGVLDDGFDYLHHDLKPNLSTSLDYDFRNNDAHAQMEAGDYHGTLVAGVIGAAADNKGMLGVAHESTLVGYRMGFGSNSLAQIDGAFKMAKGNVDVLNNSWGFTSPYADSVTSLPTLFASLADLATNGRNGLGTAVVFAAGNAGHTGDNTNYHGLTNSAFSITVGALDNTGKAAYFTTPGSSVLVSAGGVRVATTDGAGATGAVSSDYAYTSGTSFAAPMVSGVIGLMLQANSKLGARDIQDILVLSTKQTALTTGGWQNTSTSFANGGVMKYSHSLGFGLVDAGAAVRLAETWTSQATFKNVAAFTASNSTRVNLVDGGVASSKITVNSDIVIDRVEVTLNLSHGRGSDLEIYLVGPDGTRSMLADNAKTTGAYTSGFTYSSVAHWGQMATGTWTVEVRDTVTGVTGTLNNWSIKFTGDKDVLNDTYFITDMYGAYTKTAFTLSDKDGGVDTLNLSATTTNNVLNLQAGFSSLLAGRLTFNDGTYENALLGDGNDTVYGNAAANIINTGRGNDFARGWDGNDVLIGGAGNDTLYGDAANDWIYGGSGYDILNGGSGFDRFVFETLEGGADRVMDFKGTADILDFSSLLTGYKVTDDLSNWLTKVQSGTDTVLSISQTGNKVFSAVAILSDTTASSLDLAALVRTGNIDLIV